MKTGATASETTATNNVVTSHQTAAPVNASCDPRFKCASTPTERGPMKGLVSPMVAERVVVVKNPFPHTAARPSFPIAFLASSLASVFKEPVRN